MMSNNKTEQTEPEGPPGYPILGHLPGFLRDKLGFLSVSAEKRWFVDRLKALVRSDISAYASSRETPTASPRLNFLRL